MIISYALNIYNTVMFIFLHFKHFVKIKIYVKIITVIKMKLVTFQTFDALKNLINNGELICDENYINLEKSGLAYKWVLEKMNKVVKNNTKAKYPIWCWAKCYSGICPPKHRGEKVKGFDVKITFNKPEKDVFITDFRRYSFLLNNMYIPNTLREKEQFLNKMKKLNITSEELKMYARTDKDNFHREDKEYLQLLREIRKTFDRCITKDSDILQGCIWNIKLSEVENIEILPNDGYTYGSLNYKRSNGKRIDWQKDYYKLLK